MIGAGADFTVLHLMEPNRCSMSHQLAKVTVGSRKRTSLFGVVWKYWESAIWEPVVFLLSIAVAASAQNGNERQGQIVRAADLIPARSIV
jgi:hypothetical protein